jgi:hypothetical protein
MRRRDGTSDHFDLLPFIAILMCVLGCLLLVTISVAAITMGFGSNEVWIPAPSDPGETSKIPILCEWDGKTAIFHMGRVTTSTTWVPPDDSSADPNPEFSKVTDDIKSENSTHYILIAVRPSGFANFDDFAAEFRRKDIAIGYEPIGQGRPLELRVSDNSMPQGASAPSTTQQSLLPESPPADTSTQPNGG